jgi:hypothetical protein
LKLQNHFFSTARQGADQHLLCAHCNLVDSCVAATVSWVEIDKL